MTGRMFEGHSQADDPSRISVDSGGYHWRCVKQSVDNTTAYTIVSFLEQ